MMITWAMINAKHRDSKNARQCDNSDSVVSAITHSRFVMIGQTLSIVDASSIFIPNISAETPWHTNARCCE
jgi:hypothetical protein